MNDEQLLNQLRAMRVDREPVHDLWPGIDARITARRSWTAPAWMAMAASVLLLFGALLVPRPGTAPLPQPGSSVIELAATSGMRADDVSGISRALVKANLQIAGMAEKDLQAALLLAPESPQLLRMLRSARQQQSHMRALL